MPGQAHLVQRPALYGKWPDPFGDQHPGFDGVARRDDRRPAEVFQGALGGELR